MSSAQSAAKEVLAHTRLHGKTWDGGGTLAPYDVPEEDGMAARVFSVSNMKGGVGKTTVAIALAHELAKGENGQGARVLIIDLDAQANASFWICGDQTLTRLIEEGKTVEAFLEDAVVFSKTVALGDYVHQAPPPGPGQISIIPSSPELRLIERELIVFLSRRRRNLLEVERVVSDLLETQLASLRECYDYILFDSAPGISALTEAALRSSEVVVVPTVPDFISNLGLEAFCKSVYWSNHADTSPPQRKPWVLANMVKSTPAHRAMLDEMRTDAGSPDGSFYMFDIEVPDTPWIEEAALAANGDSKERFTAKDSDIFRKLAAEVLSAADRATAIEAPRAANA